MAITLSNFTTDAAIDDTQTIDPFASATISDSVADDQVAAVVSFATANGTLSGLGLSGPTVAGGVATYTLAATSAAQLQNELQALTFTPAADQGASGAAVTTGFTLAVTGVPTSPSVILALGFIPEGVATDMSGDLYVPNDGGGTVEEFSASGALLRTLSTGVSNPMSVATDAAGDVFVANSGDDTVAEFSASGSLLHVVSTGISPPIKVATDAGGDMFVVLNPGSFSNAVTEYSASGDMVRNLSTEVSGPTAVAMDASGNLFVACAGVDEVVEFSAVGALVRTLTQGVNSPVSVATDASGDLFVANSGDDTVAEFSNSGALLRVLSSGVNGPVSVVADLAGDVYVANAPLGGAGPNNVEEFSATGALLRTLSSGISFDDQGTEYKSVLTTDAAGDLFVANAADDTVSEFAPIATAQNSTTQVTTVPPAVAPEITGVTPSVATMSEATVSPFASVTIGDSNPGARDTLTITLSGAGGALTGAGLTAAGVDVYTLSGSHGIVTGELEALAFTPTAGAPNSSSSTMFTLSDVSSAYGAMATTATTSVVNTDGSLVLSGFADSAITDAQTVAPFATTTISDAVAGDQDLATISFTAANGTLSGSGLSGPSVAGGVATYTLAVAPGAELQSELQALTFTPTVGATATTTFTLSVTSGMGPNETLGANNPYALVVDGSGDLFVGGESGVEEYSASGVPLNSLIMANPYSLATDPSGDLFVANINENEVQEFSAAGALIQTLSVPGIKQVATDSSGDVFVIGYAHEVDEYSASGVLVSALDVGIPTAIATDTSGDVFVVSQVGNTPYRTLQAFSGSGQLNYTVSGIPSAGAMAADAAGDVFLANPNQHTVTEYSASGAILRVLATGFVPTSLAVDAAGDVYVRIAQVNDVEEFSATGALLRTLSVGVGTSPLSQSLAVDASGDLFVANPNGDNTVTEFAPSVSTQNSTTQVTTTPAERWTGGTGNWSTAARWTYGAPTLASDAVIDGMSSIVTLSGAATVASLSVGSSASLTVKAGLEITNMLNVSGARITISGGALQLDDGGAISGLIAGQGALALTGGDTTFAAGAGLATASWRLGTGATTTLDEALVYAGSFSAGGGAQLTLSGGSLAAHGATTLAGLTATSAISKGLFLYGATSVSGLTIAGDAFVENFAATTQNGDALTIGDNVSTDRAVLYNATNGVWNITDDSGVGVGADTASFILNYGLFEKTQGSATSIIAVSVNDVGSIAANAGTLAFAGASNSFAGAISGAGTVLFSGGLSRLKAGAAITVAHLAEAGAGTSLGLMESVSYSGGFTQGAGTTLAVGSGFNLSLSGVNALSGATFGAGALALTGGQTTFAAGARLATASWSLGTGAMATLDEGLVYGGSFSAGGGSQLTLSGGGLAIHGATTLAGFTATSATSKGLFLYGATSVSGLTIAGDAVVENLATTTQNGGSLTIGDNVSTDRAVLYNGANAVWNITDDSGVGRGADAASVINNLGLFEKTAGTAVSVITTSMINNGTVVVASGTEEFKAAITGTGTDMVSGASTLKFDAAVGSNQSIAFSGAGGALFLSAPRSFSALISGFDAGGSQGVDDSLQLLGNWAETSLVGDGSRTLMTLSQGAAHATLTFEGTPQGLAISQSGGVTTITGGGPVQLF